METFTTERHVSLVREATITIQSPEHANLAQVDQWSLTQDVSAVHKEPHGPQPSTNVFAMTSRGTLQFTVESLVLVRVIMEIAHLTVIL